MDQYIDYVQHMPAHNQVFEMCFVECLGQLMKAQMPIYIYLCSCSDAVPVC